MVTFFIVSCNSNKPIQITQKNDFQKYLNTTENDKLEDVKKDIVFWEKKYNDSPNQYTYLVTLSGLYSQLFILF